MRIAIISNKGGILKTTTSINLAGALANDKNKILLIDCDGQANVSTSFGINADTLECGLYDVLLEGKNINDVIIKVDKYIDVLPSKDDMNIFEIMAMKSDIDDKFNLLNDALSGLNKRYDYIIFDTPPQLGLIIGNVITAAEEIIVPTQLESYGMRSLIKTLGVISDFKEKFNINAKISGVLLTLVDTRTVLHSEMLQQCRRFCLENNIKLFDTVIPRSIQAASSVAFDKKPLTLTKSKSPLSKAYFDFKEEVINHGKKDYN